MKCREIILDELHEMHPGICRMKALARNYVWWPNIDKDIESKIHLCDSCQIHRHDPAKHPYIHGNILHVHGPGYISTMPVLSRVRCS